MPKYVNIRKPGSPSQKPGFVGQDFVGSYGFFLRFSNRGHSLFLLRLRPFESSIRIFNRASEFELPARLLSWNGSRAGGSTSPSSARAPRSCAWARQQTMPLLARARRGSPILVSLPMPTRIVGFVEMQRPVVVFKLQPAEAVDALSSYTVL